MIVPNDARRETARLVRPSSSDLVELALNLRRWHVVAELHESKGHPGRVRTSPSGRYQRGAPEAASRGVPRLYPASPARSRPGQAVTHGHRLHGEMRVLRHVLAGRMRRPPRWRSGGREKSDGALTNRERGEIEAAHGLPALWGPPRTCGLRRHRTSGLRGARSLRSDTTRILPASDLRSRLTVSSSMRFTLDRPMSPSGGL